MLHSSRASREGFMKPTLLIPGLLWPAKSLPNAVRDLELPALSVLLGRGRIRWTEPLALEDWLARAWGLDAREAPWAAIRLAGETAQEPVGGWICADPMHVRFARDTFVAAGPHELAIRPEEAEALLDTLNRELGDLGRFVAPHPERWYLRTTGSPDLRAPPPRRVWGRRVSAHLPSGSDARKWSAFANDCEVLLHGHPVNAAREARGEPAVSNLWFWGPGELAGTVARHFDAVCADEPLARGLAAASGADCLQGGAGFEALGRRGADRVLALPGVLEVPALCAEIDAWRAALASLERQWFAPALDALRAGRIAELRMCAIGDEATLELTVSARDRWRLWRRPLALATLTPP